MSRYLLFDLDGTLTESGEGIIRSVQYALEKMADLAGNTRPEWGCEKNTHEKAILSCNRSKKMIRYSYINIV